MIKLVKYFFFFRRYTVHYSLNLKILSPRMFVSDTLFSYNKSGAHPNFSKLFLFLLFL